MIVEVLHPAAVSYVPRGGRSPRHAYVATRTPVELRAIPQREMREVGRLRSMAVPPSLYEHGGILWKRLSRTPYPGGEYALSPKDWTSWLAGDAKAGDEVSRILAMTPLAALVHPSGNVRSGGLPWGQRGDTLDLGFQRGVVSDAREAAAAAVARFLEQETLVTETAAYVRHRPVAVERKGSPAMADGVQSLDMEFLPLSPLTARWDVRLRRHETAASDIGRSLFAEDLRTLAPFIEDDADVTLLANWLPRELALMVAERARRLPEAYERERARMTRAAAEGIAQAGDVGGIDPADARDILERVTRLAIDELRLDLGFLGPDLSDTHDPYGHIRPRREWLWAGAVPHLLRVLERTEPRATPDDEDAMAGMEGPR